MKNIDKAITELGKSTRKEFAVAAFLGLLFLVLSLVIYFFLFDSIIVLLVAFPSLIGVPFLYLARYPASYRTLIRKREEEFSSLMSYLRVYLDNGYNTYRSLNLLVPLASFWMQGRLNDLISEIDCDKTIAPYLKFSSCFKDSLVEQIMVALYQVTENGYSSRFFENFLRIKHDITNISRKNETERFKNGLKNLTLFPLATAGLMTVIITLGILQVIGGMISGF